MDALRRSPQEHETKTQEEDKPQREQELQQQDQEQKEDLTENDQDKMIQQFHHWGVHETVIIPVIILVADGNDFGLPQKQFRMFGTAA